MWVKNRYAGFFEFLRIFLNHSNSDGKRILWYCSAWYVRFFSFCKLIFSSDRSSLRRVVLLYIQQAPNFSDFYSDHWFVLWLFQWHLGDILETFSFTSITSIPCFFNVFYFFYFFNVFNFFYFYFFFFAVLKGGYRKFFSFFHRFRWT